jgi:hypothetical protein
MKWTKAHSRNAVAAKAHKRMAEPVFDEAPARKFRLPRARARFRITIRDEQIGDSLTLSLTPMPWRGRFLSSDRQELSTYKICRAMREILNHE